MNAKICAAALAGAMLGGCGGMSANMNPMNWWSGGPQERSPQRLAGATRYVCDGGRQFAVRFGGDGQQSAMVILPEREFRLDPVPGASAGLYSNGRSTLITKGDEVSLEEAGSALFANCKRADAGPG